MKKFFLAFLSITGLLFGDAPAAPSGNNYQTFLMIGVAIVCFYFILLRPEQKRRKALEKQRSSMKKGDKVTVMGIMGTLFQIRDKSVILKMVDGAKIEVLKAAITDVQQAEEAKSVEVQEAEVEKSS